MMMIKIFRFPTPDSRLLILPGPVWKRLLEQLKKWKMRILLKLKTVKYFIKTVNFLTVKE